MPGLAPISVAARLDSALPANDHRADHLRCRLLQNVDGTLVAHPAPRQDSGMMRTLSESDAIILRAPHAPPAAAGETVQVLRLDHLGV